VFELVEEAFDQVPLAVEGLAEPNGVFAVGFWRDVGCCALCQDQRADTIAVIGLVTQDDRAGTEMIEQLIGYWSIMGLPATQAEPDREPLRVDDDVDLGREPTAGTTETRISTPLFPVAACWCARTEVLSIIWTSPSCAAVMASISRSHTPALRHRINRL
jgi:hypothetical protein